MIRFEKTAAKKEQSFAWSSHITAFPQQPQKKSTAKEEKDKPSASPVSKEMSSVKKEESKSAPAKKNIKTLRTYRCNDCMSIYDSTYDRCPICGSDSRRNTWVLN